MSFMLGSFAGGLFGGAGSVMSLYGGYQQLKQTQQGLDAADAVKEARDADAAKGQATNDDATNGYGALQKSIQDADARSANPQSGGAPAGPAVGPVAVPEGTTRSAPGATPALDATVRSAAELPTTSRMSAAHDPNALPTPAPEQAGPPRPAIAPYATPPQTPVAPGAAPVATAPSNMATYDTPAGGYVDRPASAPPAATPGQQPVFKGLPQADPNLNPTQADVASQVIPPAHMPIGPNLGRVTQGAPGENVARAWRGDPALPSATGAQSGQYDTKLSATDEAKYQAWAKANGKENDTQDYDLRGAWKSGAALSENGHLPDTFKKPNHPTFSDQSQYSSPETPGGSWVDQGNGKWAFNPSAQNLKTNSPAGLQDYFDKREPGNTVNLPAAQQAGPPAPSSPTAPTVGSRISSMLGIGSAQAGELTPAQRAGEGLAPPGAPAPGAAPYPQPGDRVPGTMGQTVPAAGAPAPPTGTPAISPTVGGTPPAGGAQNAANPTQVAAQQSTERPAPAAGPAAVTVPAATAQVAPNQSGDTTQSEATPHLIKPMVNQSYYTALANQAPAWRAHVDQIAAQEGVSPDRLAAHWFAESGFETKMRDGKAGEQGIMQMMPATRKMVDPKGELDPNKPEDSLRMGAKYIALMDREFGRDTAGSVAAYQGGPGSADAIARDPANAQRYHPQTMAYAQKIFAEGTTLGADHFSVGTPPDPRSMIQAAKSGPDGFMSYIASTGGQGMQMSDKWRQAETALMVAAISKGDYQGVAHARDFVLQQSQQGFTDNTMQADKLLMAGDGAGAAQYLAKAHAFFPDGTTGQFAVDKSNQVWAQRVDEHDPSRKLGTPVQVTHEALQHMLIQTRDPNHYVKLVNEQQKSASELRLQAAQTINTLDEPGSRARTAQVAQQGHEMAAQTGALNRQSAQTIAAGHDDATLVGAEIRAGNKGSGGANAKALDTEVGKAWGAEAMSDDGKTPLTSQQRSLGSQIHHDLRTSAESGGAPVTGPHAEYLAKGLLGGTLQVVPGADGRYGVVDPKNPTEVLGVVSGAMGSRLKGSQFKPATKPNQSPIGALASAQTQAPTSTMVH